jgi:nucleoid-associated protein YgaU
MPNDARLGLVVGVTLVILVAVLFSRKDGFAPPRMGVVQAPPGAAVKMGTVPKAPVSGLPGTPVPLRGLPPTHTVEEGETLMSLAVRYYGDPGQVSTLYRANLDRILSPDRVPVGTVLRIPDRGAKFDR